MRIFGFIHVATFNDWERILQDQLGKINNSGLIAVTEAVAVSLVGPHCLTLGSLGGKIHIAHRSENACEYEFPALKLLQETCCRTDCCVWYIHSKGVSKTGELKTRIEDWRLYMEHFVIERYAFCIEALWDHDVCGVDWHRFPMPHFSGNFWWARSDYIRTLPEIGDIDCANRGVAEFWIGMNKTVRAKILFESGVDHYKQRYEPCGYRSP